MTKKRIMDLQYFMEYNTDKKEIRLDRKLNELDKFVMGFCSILDKYVIISGYVSILLGEKKEFVKLRKKINRVGFECLKIN